MIRQQAPQILFQVNLGIGSKPIYQKPQFILGRFRKIMTQAIRADIYLVKGKDAGYCPSKVHDVKVHYGLDSKHPFVSDMP
jgi:hypothetical protein